MKKGEDVKCGKIHIPIKVCCAFLISQHLGCRNYFLRECSVKGSCVLYITPKLSSGRRPPSSLPQIQPRNFFLYLALPNPLSIPLPTLSPQKRKGLWCGFYSSPRVTPHQCNCKWIVVTCRSRSLVMWNCSVLIKQVEGSCWLQNGEVSDTFYIAQSNARMGNEIMRDICKGGRNLIMQDRYVIGGSSAWLHTCTTKEEIVPSDKNPT